MKISLYIIIALLAIYIGYIYLAFSKMFKYDAFNDGKRFGMTSFLEEKILSEVRWLMAQKDELISIKSYDGLDLNGHYIRRENAKRLVVCFHGWKGSWFYDNAMPSHIFSDLDSDILLIEQRSQNHVDGRFMTFGLIERKDVSSWMEYVSKTNTKDLPVYLFGLSMGATTVMMSSSDTFKCNLKGIIADCGFTSPIDILSWQSGNMKLPVGITMFGVKIAFRLATGTILTSWSCPKALENAKYPVLFITGKKDLFVDPVMSRRNYEACTSPKTLLEIDNAGHALSCYFDTKKYTDEVANFFNINDN